MSSLHPTQGVYFHFCEGVGLSVPTCDKLGVFSSFSLALCGPSDPSSQQGARWLMSSLQYPQGVAHIRFLPPSLYKWGLSLAVLRVGSLAQ